MSVSVSLVAQPFKAGKLKVLGVGSTERVAALPDVPTVAEAGLPGYEATTWFGLATTGGTPRDVVLKINAEVQKILNEPQFRERFMAPQMFESMASSPEEFAQRVKAETKLWAKVVREQNLKIE
jgi:tripartite-type tricarboxylate transporter receptor subunit TctC